MKINKLTNIIIMVILTAVIAVPVIYSLFEDLKQKVQTVN